MANTTDPKFDIVADFSQAVARHARGEFAWPEQIYRRILAENPYHDGALHYLGVLALQQGRPEAAVETIGRALALAPENTIARYNYGHALAAAGRPAEAFAAYRRVVAENPGHAAAWRDIGVIHYNGHRLDEALACFQRAVAIDPEYADAQLDIAHVHLRRGNLKEGLRRYRWRWRTAALRDHVRDFLQPEWDGSDLHGRTILVLAEQGYGDTLMFARFAPMVRARGGRVAIEVQRGLAGLMEGLPGVSAVVADGDPLPPFDVHASMGALAGILAADDNAIPAMRQYLWADPWLAREWGVRLRCREPLSVGLVWAGEPGFVNDKDRSPRLGPLLPLLDVPGVRFFVLQMGDGRRDLEGMTLPANVTDLGPAIKDFGDTAAIVANLDMVISSCTGPAHLAAALGRPVWLLLSFSPDWRWGLGRDDSPWYPSMRLFRQPAPGDWASVTAAVTTALAAVCPGPKSAPPDLDAHYREARAHRTAGRMLEAELGYRSLLADAPDNVLALRDLGLVLAALGRLASARIWIERARTLDPALPPLTS